VTIKRENGKYYAIVNITTTVEELEKTGKSIVRTVKLCYSK
jgi:hypothetical protein